MKKLVFVTLLVCALVSGALLGACSSGAASASGSAAASESSSVAAESTAEVSQSADASGGSSVSAELSAGESQSVAASESASAAVPASLPDGEYQVPVSTDSNMFHLNETSEGMGVLTVKDGAMSVHITLVSKKITVLYAGKRAQAKEDEASWIQPTTDTVTYSDGQTEEVYGFDIPVPVLDEPFDVAILGSKDNWYDHTVTVSSPVSE